MKVMLRIKNSNFYNKNQFINQKGTIKYLSTFNWFFCVHFENKK